MADAGDWVTENDAFMQAKRDEARRREREAAEARGSALECEECGNEIPEGRRQAITGCRLCVGCQEATDSKNQHRRVRALLR